jgi:hypothetical protein
MTNTTCPCECHVHGFCNYNGGCGDADHRGIAPTAPTKTQNLGYGTVYTAADGRQVSVQWDANFNGYLIGLVQDPEAKHAFAIGPRFTVVPSVRYWHEDDIDALVDRVFTADPSTLPESYNERVDLDFLAEVQV